MKRNRMKRWAVRILAGIALLAMLTIGGACAVFAFVTESRSIPGVARDSVVIDDTHTASYLHAGDPGAQRIIYVHGSPGSATAWARYLKNPMPGFESIAIDRFGFGDSSPQSPVTSLAEQAKAIEPFLVEQNGKWPILVGHSLGGTIACQAAVDFPGRVGGLVILAGALAPEMEKIHWYQRVADFAFVPALLPKDLTTSNRELMPLKGELKTLANRLGEITCPVAIIHGEKDRLVPVANAAFMQEKISGDVLRSLTILPKGNHFLPWTAESTTRISIESLAADNRSSE